MNFSKKTFSASLVGLQYHQVPIDVYDAVQKDFITLRRDKANQHDRNAIEVIIRTYKVGYIDKSSASIFAPLLDNAYSYQVSANSVDRNKKSIKLNVVFYISEIKKANKPDLPVNAGIYKITVNQNQQVYIGQSINIKERISSHWDMLQFNSHSNKKLQSLWNHYGENSFSASVLEAVPPDISSELERQRWLAQKEKFWIQQTRENGNCINITDGEIITTKGALAEYIEEEKQFAKEHDERIKELKEKLKPEIDEAHKIYFADKNTYMSLLSKVTELEAFIRDNTGIWGFLSGSTRRSEAKGLRPKLEDLRKELRASKEKLNASESEYTNLKARYSKLKTHKQIQRDLDRLSIRLGVLPSSKKTKIT